MPIAPTDLKPKLSILTGSAGNASAQADPNQSLGKYVSTTEASASVDALFDAVSGAENAALDVEYRCIFLHNDHASLTLIGAVVYVSAETAGGANIAIGVDPTAASAKGASAAQAVQVANESTAPAGVTFSTPTTEGTGLALGDIPAGSVKGIWLRRTATNSAAINNDGATLSYAGDTGA